MKIPREWNEEPVVRDAVLSALFVEKAITHCYVDRVYDTDSIAININNRWFSIDLWEVV